MSQENLERVLRKLFEGFDSKDVGAIEAAMDPEGELLSRFAAVDGKVYRGYAGISDYLADMEAVWEDYQIETKELIPAGEEKLVVVARVTGTARGSGIPLDQSTFGVYEFRHERALRAEWFATRSEALKAVGLAE